MCPAVVAAVCAFAVPLALRRLATGAGPGPADAAVPVWHAGLVPDYTLFGDEHVRQYEATGGKVGHEWNGASCLVPHTYPKKTTREIPVVLLRPR
jgi:hypothetical protein